MAVIHEDLFSVTLFKSKEASYAIPSRVSLLELSEQIESEVADKKELLTWVKLAKFGKAKSEKGSLRHDANVIGITGCEGDYDSGKISFSAAATLLREANIGCLICTTPSHTPDLPRWRVFAPTSHELSPDARYQLVARINGALGGVLSAESFTLSQSYYMGHLNNGGEFRIELIEGRYIDLCSDLDARAVGRPGHKPSSGNGPDFGPRADITELVRMILSGASLHPPVASIAGVYAARGSPKADCIDLIGAAFDAAKQPRYGGRWDECLEVIDWVYAKEARKSTPTVPAAAVWDDIGDGTDIPDQEWTVPDLIPAHEVCLLSGYGGGGKSTVGLHLASAHVMCLPWLNVVPEQGPAFFIDAEDHPDVIKRRIAAITRHFGCSFRDLTENGLKVMSLHGKDAVMANADRNGVIRPTALYETILAEAEKFKPAQIILAPSSHVYAGSEIDRSQVTQFVSLLSRLAVASGGSVVLISHPSLTGMTNQSGISGSTGWHNAVRSRMYLETLKNGEGADEQPEHELRVLRFLKNQYGPPAKEITLRYQSGMFLPEPTATSYEIAAAHAKAEAVFITVLRRLLGIPRPLSDKVTAHNYAPKAIALEDEATAARVGKSDLEQAMRRLFKAKRITVAAYGKPSSGWTRIQEAPTASS